jgi:hypothetical protein
LSRGIALDFVAADVLYGDIPDLANLDQVGLVVTFPWFTLRVIYSQCFYSSSEGKEIEQVVLDNGIKPLFV